MELESDCQTFQLIKRVNFIVLLNLPLEVSCTIGHWTLNEEEELGSAKSVTTFSLQKPRDI